MKMRRMVSPMTRPLLSFYCFPDTGIRRTQTLIENRKEKNAWKRGKNRKKHEYQTDKQLETAT
jgi:hypothetical protein